MFSHFHQIPSNLKKYFLSNKTKQILRTKHHKLNTQFSILQKQDWLQNLIKIFILQLVQLQNQNPYPSTHRPTKMNLNNYSSTPFKLHQNFFRYRIKEFLISLFLYNFYFDVDNIDILLEKYFIIFIVTWL